MVTVTIKSSGASGKYRTYTKADYGKNISGAAKPSEGVIGKKAGTYTTSTGQKVTITEGTKSGGAPQKIRTAEGVPVKEVAPGVLVSDTGELISYKQSTRESPAVAAGYSKESYAALSPGEKKSIDAFYEKYPAQEPGVKSAQLIITRRGTAGEAVRSTTPQQMSQAIIARQQEQEQERKLRLQQESFLAERGLANYQTTDRSLYKTSYEGGQNASYNRSSSNDTFLGVDRYGFTPINKTFTKEGVKAAGQQLGRLGYSVFISPVVGSYQITKYNKIYPTPFGAVAIPKGKTFAEKYRSTYLTGTNPDVQQLGLTVATLPFVYTKPLLAAKLGVGYAGYKTVTEPSVENVINLGAAGAVYGVVKYQASKPQVTFGEFSQYGEPVKVRGTIGDVRASGKGTIFTRVKVYDKTFEQVNPAEYYLNIKGVRSPTVSGEIKTTVTIPGKKFSVFGKEFVVRKPKQIPFSEKFTGGIETLYGTAPTSKYVTYQGMKFKVSLKDTAELPVVEPVGSRLAVSSVDKSKVFLAESKFTKNVDLQYQGINIGDAQTYKTTGALFERNKQGFLVAKSTTKGVGSQEIIDYNKLSFITKRDTSILPGSVGRTTVFSKSFEKGYFGGVQLVSTGGGTKGVGGVNYRLASKGFRLLERKGIREPGVIDTNIDYAGSFNLLLRSRKGQVTFAKPSVQQPTIVKSSRNIGGSPFDLKTPIPELSGYRLSNVGGVQFKAPVIVNINKNKSFNRPTNPILLNKNEIISQIKERSLPKILSEQKREYRLNDDLDIRNRSRTEYVSAFKQEQNIEQRSKLIQSVDVLSRSEQKQTVKQTQVYKQPFKNISLRNKGITTFVIPPISFKDDINPKRFVTKKSKVSFRESRYTPSVYAITGGITGKPTRASTFTGLGVRPILKSKRIGASL